MPRLGVRVPRLRDGAQDELAVGRVEAVRGRGRVVLELVVAPAPGFAVALLVLELLRYRDVCAEVGPPVDPWAVTTTRVRGWAGRGSGV